MAETDQLTCHSEDESTRQDVDERDEQRKDESPNWKLNVLDLST